MADLTNPIFTDEDAARRHFEATRWPDGPYCPLCGSFDKVKPFGGKSMGPGWYYCSSCRRKFTATMGTVCERSHIPLNKWLLAMHLMTASKKGMSAHQLHRMLGVTYQSAWFMAHRLREAMKPTDDAGPIGGENKIVEADETYVGGKAKNRAYAKKPPKKQAVMTLIDRDNGETRSFHVANVTAKMLRPLIVKVASRQSFLMTDESVVYPSIGAEFSGHGTVNHSANEY